MYVPQLAVSDIRDEVVALLRITCDGEEIAFSLNCSVSEKEFFVDFARTNAQELLLG